VINNADRKRGHVLPMPTGVVHGVDHGVSFNVDDKLRTVLWGWAGRTFDAEEDAVLNQLCAQIEGTLGDRLRELLTAEEVEVTAARIRRLLAERAFPLPGDGWPSIPWPPF
jgi:uncharacterized repeat protein (TIGR03843 family)